MASRIFVQASKARVLAASSALGVTGLVGTLLGTGGDQDVSETAAEIQFHTSFGYNPAPKFEQLIKPPPDWKGRLFQIRNDYPTSATKQDVVSKELPPMPGPDRPLPGLDPIEEARWLRVDFLKEPLKYCQLIKEYCWEGNVNNEFVLQNNQIRNWYHAPWMHWNANGREPLNGLTFERPTPPLELSKTQNRMLQTWACGFYNEPGARMFGDIWKDPNNPQWNKFKFPKGTCVFKILMTDAKDDEVPSMKDAPAMQAVISPQDATSGILRNNFPSTLRLLQVDFAVRDDRAPIGWVFGTFMYNGNMKNKDAWDRVMPVGIMWGNDPDLWPADVANGKKPQESWINPEADALRESLGGTRPSWGFGGRMNGPADYFRSACASCHSTSSRDKYSGAVWDQNCLKFTGQQRTDCDAAFLDSQKMMFFRNIKAGEALEENDVSGDYSLQLQMGYHNFKTWYNMTQKWYSTTQEHQHRTKLVVPLLYKNAREERISALKSEPMRAIGIPFDPVHGTAVSTAGAENS